MNWFIKRRVIRNTDTFMRIKSSQTEFRQNNVTQGKLRYIKRS